MTIQNETMYLTCVKSNSKRFQFTTVLQHLILLISQEQGKVDYINVSWYFIPMFNNVFNGLSEGNFGNNVQADHMDV